MQDEVAALVPESRSTTSWGTPALDLGAGVRAQLATAGVERRPGRRGLHARGRPLAVLPPRRRRLPPLRRRRLEAAVTRAGRAGHQPRGRTPSHRSGLRRRGAARRRPARRRHQVLPRLRRADPRRPRRHRRRGEPPPGGRGQGRRVRRPRAAVALHRRAPVQQGLRRGVLRRRGRVGRPRQAGRQACPAARTRAGTTSTCCSRSASTRPGPTADPAPTRPTSTSSPERSTRPGCSGCVG